MGLPDPLISKLQKHTSTLENFNKQLLQSWPENLIPQSIQSEISQMKIVITSLGEELRELSLFRGMVATLRKENDRFKQKNSSTEYSDDAIKELEQKNQLLQKEIEELREELSLLKNKNSIARKIESVSNTTVLPLNLDRVAPDFFDDSDLPEQTMEGRDSPPTSSLPANLLIGDTIHTPKRPLEPPRKLEPIHSNPSKVPTSKNIPTNGKIPPIGKIPSSHSLPPLQKITSSKEKEDEKENTSEAEKEEKWLSLNETLKLLQIEKDELDQIVELQGILSKTDPLNNTLLFSFKDVSHLRARSMEQETVMLEKNKLLKPVRRRKE